MILNIIIFSITIILVFVMLTYRAWQIKTHRIIIPNDINDRVIKIPFRQIEKIVLYSIKHVIQLIIIIIVKYWFIIIIKIRKKIIEKWPKIHNYFLKKNKTMKEKKISFLNRTILELKGKIKHIKEKVKKEN